ncbi:CapA family protein [Agrobacterium tumefaciens]
MVDHASHSLSAMRITFAGDCIATKAEELLWSIELGNLVRSSDVVVCNLEMPLCEANCIPMPASVYGHLRLRADPKTAEFLNEFGISHVNLANNHIMDYSHKGLDETLSTLSQANIGGFGAGRSLQEAYSCTYHDTGREVIGFMGLTLVAEDHARAARASKAFPTRPGVNYLDSEYTIGLGNNFDRISLDRLQGVLAEHHGDRYTVRASNDPNIAHRFNKAQLHALELRVGQAKKDCDFLVIYVHGHMANEPSAFLNNLRALSVRLASAGADFIAHHGTHQFHHCEFLGQALVLYGLGNFCFQAQYLDNIPSECFDLAGIQEENDLYFKLVEKRQFSSPVFWESFICEVEVQNGKIAYARAVPVALGGSAGSVHRGIPRIPDESKTNGILERLTAMSRGHVNISAGGLISPLETTIRGRDTLSDLHTSRSPRHHRFDI